MRYLSQLLLILPAMFAACTVNGPEQPSQPQEPLPELNGTAIVYFSEAVTERIEAAGADAPELFADQGVCAMERLFPNDGVYEARTRAEGLHRWYLVSYLKTRAGNENGLQSLDGAQIQTAPHRIRKRSKPNDTYYDQQWALRNNGTLGKGFVNGCDLNVEPVWEQYTTGYRRVIVSVVDGGVDPRHPDIQGNLIPASTSGSWNFVTNSANITTDDHGTHVAGVIAAVRNNNRGIAGIAGGDDGNYIRGARILNCQIFDDHSEATDAATCRALKWGADHGAVICQNSWGPYADENKDYVVSAKELAKFKATSIYDSDYAYVKDGIDYFVKYAGCDANGNQRPDSPMKGGVVFFASGNEDIDYDPICIYDKVLSVSAYGPDRQKASYSNYGDFVDFCAPGGDDKEPFTYNKWDDFLYDAWKLKGEILSTISHDSEGDYFDEEMGFDYMTGTSMACPQVSGVAALIVSYFGGHGFTAEMLTDILRGGAQANYIISPEGNLGSKVDALASFEYGIEKYGVPGPERAIMEEPVEVWPNPVDTRLLVQTDKLTNASIKLVTMTGRLLFENTFLVAPGYPVSLNLSDLAPGHYTLIVHYDGKDIKKTVIKK
ncbi:MAG: S8 family serine peptidase [Bacteroidales bacterium]|nr:S8 family serine peptidase [Bacteroidales bacterium]